jgi:uncharacterized protein YndB with AHSA1/START domain
MTTTVNPAGTPANEIVITRLIDAPLARVWRAWADPKEIVQWWGPFGFGNETVKREFKTGGIWQHTMIGPDGTRYLNNARYEEIVEFERIVYSNGGGREGKNDGIHFRATVTFVARGDKTELTLRNVFDTPAERDMVVREFGAIEGGQQTLTRLAGHVEGHFIISRLVDAPRDKIWRCWTEQERLAQWFGPKGFETVSAKLDFRPAGTYHFCMRGHGIEMWSTWTFREIEAPGRMVWIGAFSDKDGGLGRHPMAPEWPSQMLNTLTLLDFGPKTLITIDSAPYESTDAECKVFSDGRPSMQGGWGGTFDRLDAYLKNS